MRIFEFQFNPKAAEDRFFRVYSFEESPGQGNMYIVGELENALPTNASFLDRLSAILQQEYYGTEKQKQAPASRLKNALKKANSFLAEEAKNGNVDWLGNFHLLLLLLVPQSSGYALYFTKVGKTQLWMARSGSLVDAGKSIDEAKQKDSSAKVFGNVGSGKVMPGDRVMALTQEAFQFFSKENFLQTIAQLQEEKQFQKIFKSKQKEMAQFSGVLFFVLIEDRGPSKESARDGQAHSLAQVKLPAFASKISRPALPKIPTSFAKLPKPKLLLPAPSFATKNLSFFTASEPRKRMGLLALFLSVLLFGFVIWGSNSQNPVPEEEAANTEIELTEELRQEYHITEIENLEVASRLMDSPALEQAERMVQASSQFYFFGPSSQNIVVFDGETNASEVLNAGKRVSFGTSQDGSPLFFAEPNVIVAIEGQNRVVQRTIENLPADAHIGAFSQFAQSAYLLDTRKGEIFKAPLSVEGELSVERWLDLLSAKKPINARAMGIDGSIWVLAEDNEIQRYFRGAFEESLQLDIVPELREAVMLKTNSQSPYLYLLDASQKRLVILQKTGRLVRQYRAEELARVRDFSVSPDGQTIHLFDGENLYRISPVAY